MNGIQILLLATGIMVSVLIGITLLAQNYSLNGIKSKTVGDGQHGNSQMGDQGGDPAHLPPNTLYAPAVAGVGRPGCRRICRRASWSAVWAKAKRRLLWWTPGTSMCL